MNPLVWFGHLWVARRIRTGLDGVFEEGWRAVVEASAEGPLVLAVSHQSWWDGLIVLWLCRRDGLEPIVLADANNLQKFRFFHAFGLRGVDGLKGVRQAIREVQHPGQVLVIFPQGRYETSVQQVARGTAYMVKRLQAPLFVMGLDYRLEEAPVVRARAWVGGPVGPETLLEALQDAVARAAAVHAAQVPAKPSWAVSMANWLWDLRWR